MVLSQSQFILSGQFFQYYSLLWCAPTLSTGSLFHSECFLFISTQSLLIGVFLQVLLVLALFETKLGLFGLVQRRFRLIFGLSDWDTKLVSSFYSHCLCRT